MSFRNYNFQIPRKSNRNHKMGHPACHVNGDQSHFKICISDWALKAYVSEEILNWHSLSLSADLCINFYCLSRLRQASQRKMIQSSALRIRLKEGFCIQFFRPRTRPKTFLKFFALEYPDSKAKHCKSVLGLLRYKISPYDLGLDF